MPGQIRDILKRAEDGTFDTDPNRLDYFLGHIPMDLQSYDEYYQEFYEKGEAVISYSWQALEYYLPEHVLRIMVDGVYIPYQGPRTEKDIESDVLRHEARMSATVSLVSI